ncbi:amino acid permease [Desulfatiferula olefinivorans]
MSPDPQGNGLSRDIGLFTATVLVIANMVGTGIFTTSGFIMAELKSPAALLICWAAGGLFALCGALSYGELGARFPKAGGEYVFLRECFGPPLGFLSGWISLIVGFSAPIAAAALAFATYGFQVLGIDGSHALVSVSGVALISPRTLSAVGVIVLMSLVHASGLKRGSRVQNALTVFKAALIVCFIAAGLIWGRGSFDQAFSAGFTVKGLSAESFAVSLIFVSFAYSGWNASAYMGSEIINPRRSIPLSLFWGTLIVAALYVLLNVVYLYALPPSAMMGVMEIGAVSAVALFGDGISRLFSAAVTLGLLSVISAMILTGPRIYYAMAEDGVFFSTFMRIDSKRKTPTRSIMLQAGIAIVLVMSASFEALLIYIGFTLSLFAMLTVAGLMRLRMRGEGKNHRGYTTFAYPLTPLLFIAGNLWIIVFSVKSRPMGALFGLATMGIGLLAYGLFTRKTRLRTIGPGYPAPALPQAGGDPRL